MRKICIILNLLFFTIAAHSAKLDITAVNTFYIKSFSNLINQNKNYNLSYYNQNTSISFTLKNINLEKTDNSYMDVSVGFKSVSIENSSKTINSLYLNDLYNYNSKNPSYVYSDRAYVRIYNFIYDNIIATFGKQPYTLSSGLVLSDNSKGLDGIKFEVTNRFYLDSIDIFYFRSNNFFSDENLPENIYGLSMNKSFGDGVWQIYYINQSNSGKSLDISFTSNKTNKNFFGISYFLDKNNITYTSEFALEKGSSKDILDKTIKHNAYALNINALWKMNVPKFGKSNSRFNYLKSSGNGSSNFKENKAFYSPYTKRYDGYDRTGLGEIYKASAFDAIKTSNTLNALPDGLSGLTVASIGIDIPRNKSIISLDYFGYKATQSTSLTGLSLGTEFDIKYSLKFGEKVVFYMVYATFSPKSALKTLNTIKSTKLFSINIKAKF